jgi:dihydrofolate reductase
MELRRRRATANPQQIHLGIEAKGRAAMGKLIEATHVALGGEQGTTGWAQPYLDDELKAYTAKLLSQADMLLLGRATYQGLSAAYTAMGAKVTRAHSEFDKFVIRMNAMPKLVASRTLEGQTGLPWNASVITGSVLEHVAELKQRSGHNVLKFGNGPFSAALMKQNLIDEFHLFLTPVAIGTGKYLFSDVNWAPHLKLIDLTRFASGVVALVYGPI